jgi:hypothetical protein
MGPLENFAHKFLDYINEHFNVLLVTLVMVILLALTLHVIHDGRDTTSIQWFENLTGQFASALLTLLVANRMAHTTTTTGSLTDDSNNNSGGPSNTPKGPNAGPAQSTSTSGSTSPSTASTTVKTVDVQEELK